MIKAGLFFLFLLFATQVFAQSKQVVHLVLFQLADGVDKLSEYYAEACKAVDQLRNIPGVIQLAHGENFSTRSIARDYGLYVLLSDKEALDLYLKHPTHLLVVEQWKTMATWQIVDFEH